MRIGKYLKLSFITISVLGCLLIFVLAAGALFLAKPAGERMLARTAETLLAKYANLDITIGKLETNIFSRIQLYDTSLHVDHESEQYAILTIGHAYVEYDPAALLSRKLAVKRISLDSLQATILQDSTGSFIKPDISGGAKKDDNGSPGISIQLGELDINNSRILYKNRRYDLDAAAMNLNATVMHGSSVDQRIFSIASDSLRFAYGERSIRLEKTDINGRYEEGILFIPDIVFGATESTLSASVTVNLKGDSTAIGSFSLHGPAGELGRILENFAPPAALPKNGTLGIDGTINRSDSTIVVSGDISVAGSDWSYFAVNTLNSGFSYSSRELTLDPIAITAYDGSFKGTGRIVFADHFEHRLVLAADRVRIGDLMQAASLSSTAVRGRLNGMISSEGPLRRLDQLTFNGDITLTNGVYRQRQLPPLSANLTVQAGNLDGIMTQGPDTLTASGKLGLSAIAIDYSAELPSLDTVGWLTGVSISGSGSLRGNLSGPWGSPGYDLSYSGSNIIFNEFPIDNIDGGVHSSGKSVIVDPTILSATFGVDDEFAERYNVSGFSGGVAYACSLSGPAENPFVSMAVKLDDPAYRQFGFDEGAVDISIINKDITFESFSLSSQKHIIEGNGWYDIPGKKGNVKLITHPPTGTNGTSRSGSAPVDTTNTSGIITASFELADSLARTLKLDIDHFDASLISAITSGNEGIGGVVDGTLDAVISNNALKKVSATAMINNPYYRAIALDSLVVRGELNTSHVVIDRLDAYRDGPLLSFEGRVPVIPAEGFSPSLNFAAPVSAQLNGQEINLSVLKPLLSGDMEMYGMGTIHLILDGTLAEPSFTGSIMVSDGLISQSPDAEGINDINLAVSLGDSMIVIDQLTGMYKKTELDVHGSLNFANIRNISTILEWKIGDELAMNAEGFITPDSLHVDVGMRDFDLATLDPLTGFFINLDGLGNANIVFSGTLKEPRMHGAAMLSGITFKTPWMNRAITGGILNLSLDGRRVEVDSLMLRSRDGWLHGGGHIVYGEGGFDEIDLTADLHKFKIDQPGKYTFLIGEGNLRYHKNDERYLLDGVIHLDDSLIEYNFDPRIFIAKESKKRDGAQSDLMQKTRLSVRVETDGDLLIDNNVANVNLNAGFNIVGIPADPGILGSLSVEDGYLLYLDRRFDIMRGIITFDNPQEFKPYLDVSATANIQRSETFAGQTYVIVLTVDGPVDEASIVLTSSPALSRADLISLLTFGATTDELAGTQSESVDGTTGTIMTERVTQLSGRVASGYLSRKLSDLLGIKGLFIEGNVFGANSENEVKASDRLSQQLESSYDPDIGQSTDRGIKLRYDLSRFFSIEGYTNQTGRSGMDIEYSVSFK